MSKLINRALIKYIVWLLFSLFGSMLLAVAVHFISHYLIDKLLEKNQNLKAKIDISRHLKEDLANIHLELLQLSAATKNKEGRIAIVTTIKQQMARIEEQIIILNQGGVFENKDRTNTSFKITIPYTKEHENIENRSHPQLLEINLVNILFAIDKLTQMLDERDVMLTQQHTVELSFINDIRTFNHSLSQIFEKLQAQVETMMVQDKALLTEHQIHSQEQEQFYHLLEALIILVTSSVVLFIVYNILKQIINLYKGMESQLYIDNPTKLKNRFALLKDLKEGQNPVIAIIDINSFRTINELYGAHVGNEVLLIFANMLKHFSKNRDFTVYRISGDEFVFFKDSELLDMKKMTSLLEDFFEMMENKKIYIAQLDDCIYLDLSVGISFEKDNTLGTADIALHKAKQLHAQYLFYHSELDAVEEIKQGAFWKKRIIAGIENDLFIPFFQPIVDKERKLVKYEALMRLKQEHDGIVSFVSPHEFLEIASKTRHYDQISKMTLLKSIQKCAQTNIPISLNLNYQDILNNPLHEELKKAILKDDVGKNLIFEIIESQDIKSYAILKNFMTEFRQYGVRFAIDDFGTGFSNFSHIFELSPDFIKIDGSLIKNIHIDKKSFELVKAIVFFSKQLDIKTIAEFVHSQEVFEAAYRLGVDQFQGYYFGEPKEEI